MLFVHVFRLDKISHHSHQEGRGNATLFDNYCTSRPNRILEAIAHMHPHASHDLSGDQPQRPSNSLGKRGMRREKGRGFRGPATCVCTCIVAQLWVVPRRCRCIVQCCECNCWIEYKRYFIQIVQAIVAYPTTGNQTTASRCTERGPVLW